MPTTRVPLSSLAQRHHTRSEHTGDGRLAPDATNTGLWDVVLTPHVHRHFPAKTQAAGSASAQISRLRTRKLANEGCFGTIDRWRIPDSVRARPAARHTTSHLQKPASASCADSKAMASSAIGRAHRVSSSFVVGPGRPRLVRTREEHDFSERFSPASCPATHTRGPLGELASGRL